MKGTIETATDGPYQKPKKGTKTNGNLFVSK